MIEVMSKLLTDKNSRSKKAAEDISVEYAEYELVYWVSK